MERDLVLMLFFRFDPRLRGKTMFLNVCPQKSSFLVNDIWHAVFTVSPSCTLLRDSIRDHRLGSEELELHDSVNLNGFKVATRYSCC